MSISFKDLGISEDLQKKLEESGITVPTAVQEKVIPLILEKQHILFQSETGTGKTFAYLLPLLTSLSYSQNPQKAVKILIASPTYELASQIKVHIQKISPLKVALCIGGAPLSRQIESLKEKPCIVIGGPARLLELIHLKKLKAHTVETLVLDEADRLLSRELREATEGLLERLPTSVHIIGNSATVNAYTKKILQEVQKNAQKGEPYREMQLVTVESDSVLKNRITHWALFAERRDKIDTLRSFIHAESPSKLLVFTSKSDQIPNIVHKLQYKHIDCLGLSAKEDKKDRKTAIDRFRSGKIKTLITTDLASRGLDIPDISHVIQLDMPEESDFFIHRAGRTARAGKTGINCVIGDATELRRYATLEKKLGITVYPKMLFKGKVISAAEETDTNV